MQHSEPCSRQSLHRNKDETHCTQGHTATFPEHNTAMESYTSIMYQVRSLHGVISGGVVKHIGIDKVARTLEYVPISPMKKIVVNHLPFSAVVQEVMNYKSTKTETKWRSATGIYGPSACRTRYAFRYSLCKIEVHRQSVLC